MGGPPKTTSKDWDTSLWGSSLDSKKPEADDSSTARKWGSSSTRKDAIAGSPISSVSNDWDRTSDKGETSKWGTEGNDGGSWSWGTDATGGWGVDKNVGWGGGGGGGGGWGSGGANEWGGSVDGWGGGKAGGNTSTVSNSNDQKGKGKERQREDVEMRDSSPSRIVGSFKPIHLSHNKRESAAAPPPLSRNTPPPFTVTSKPARPLPLPLPSRKKKTQPSEDGSLIKLALQCMKKPDKEAEQIQPVTRTQAKPTPFSTKTVQGPKGRADLFSQVLK